MVNGKMLIVDVDGKEAYYVKAIEAEIEKQGKWVSGTAYAVFNDKDEQLRAFSLDVNAFIEAIQKGKIDGKGYCVAHYIEEKEKLIFEDYRLRLRISAISRV